MIDKLHECIISCVRLALVFREGIKKGYFDAKTEYDTTDNEEYDEYNKYCRVRMGINHYPSLYEGFDFEVKPIDFKVMYSDLHIYYRKYIAYFIEKEYPDLDKELISKEWHFLKKFLYDNSSTYF